MVGKKLMFKIVYIVLFLTLITFTSNSEENIDQWEDSEKSYRDLIDDGFEVKAFNTNTIQTETGLLIILFVTVLQKDKVVYECQEYQTLDNNLQTLDLSFVCRRIVQPYKIGMGT